MQPHDDFCPTPNLEAAIDRFPLIVTPETSLSETIALMSQVRGSGCLLPSEDRSLELFPSNKASSSCALIMEGKKLVGIITERDIVRLTAAEIEFELVPVARVMTKSIITLSQANFKQALTHQISCH